MVLGILFAIGSAFSSGIERILRKYVLIKEDTVCYGFLFGFFAFIGLLPLFIFKFQLPSNSYAWFLVGISGLLWTLYSLLTFKAYTYLEASIASSISRIKLFFVLIMSVIFLGESFTFEKFVGTFLIFLGVFIISFLSNGNNKMSSVNKKGIILIFISSFVISITLLIDKYAMNFFNVETYTAPVYLITPLVLLIFVMKKKDHVKSIIKRNFIPTVLASLLSAGYFYLILYAFKYAEASVVIPIVELSTLITVVGGIIFLKERTYIAHKIVASLLLIAGAVILSGKVF